MVDNNICLSDENGKTYYCLNDNKELVEIKNI